MNTSENKNYPSHDVNQPGNYLIGVEESVVPVPIYSLITDFHLRRRALDDEGNERPEQALANERSVIGDWRAFLKRNPDDAVGEELGVEFASYLPRYLVYLERGGLAETTINARKTIVTKLRESYLELQRTNGLPEGFNAALKYLFEKAGISMDKLSRKITISRSVLHRWIYTAVCPAPKSMKYIRKLERFFKIPVGALSSKLPEGVLIKVQRRSGTTPWRAHQRVLMKLTYRLPEFTDSLKAEWGEVILFFTDYRWVSERGLKRNSTWRIRWNNGRCVTGEIHYLSLRSFFGYLCLPVEGPDKRMMGLGLNPQDLTLALLTDADTVKGYLRFMKGRNVSDSFNNETVRFISLAMMLLRNETGYLRQRPEFGAKLPQQIPDGDWDRWCEDNYQKLKEFKDQIAGSKKSKNVRGVQEGEECRVRPTRNSFEPVIDIIRGRQHPLSVLFEIVSRLESLNPLMERYSEDTRAVHHRSIFHLSLIGSNPLRVENFSMMRFVPQDHASFREVSECYVRYSKEKRPLDFSKLYVVTTKDSNLYQREDGSWRLRFQDRDFKNEKGMYIEDGIRGSAYDVNVVSKVWSSLAEYLFRHRPVLNLRLRDRLQQARADRGLPPLTPEEDFAITHCPFVFRPSMQGLNASADESLYEYCAGQMLTDRLSGHVLSLTSRYLPESKGFGANACRHLVATEYIKNQPDGWDVAAVALHNTVAIVRKHYAWLEHDDLIKPWNNYYERLKEMYDKGDM